MASLLGGQITWRLDSDFETSRNVTFTMRTTWHTSDFAYTGTGIEVILGRPVQFPLSSGLTHGSKFGKLRVLAGNTTQDFPNRYIVDSINGEVVEGYLTEVARIPQGIFKANASIVLSDGSTLLRSQTEVREGLTTEIPPDGGLTACNIVGPSPKPCEIFFNGRSNPNPLNLFTTITLPRPEETSKFHFGKIRNRNSPLPFPRPVIVLSRSQDVGSLPPTFPFSAFDLDGLPSVVHYPAQSTRDGSGNINIECANGNVLTSYGCNGRDSELDIPPFIGSDYRFVTSNKVPSDFDTFFYSFTFLTTDGTDIVTTEFVINYCKPTITTGNTEVLDRAPEFITLSASGSVIRQPLHQQPSHVSYPRHA